MNVQDKMTDRDNWLAAEFALGVLGQADRAEAEKRFEQDQAFREIVEGWHGQLSPLLDDVEEINPPSAVWKDVEQSLFPQAESAASAGSGIWKLITAGMSSIAIACMAMMFYVTGGDFTGSQLAGLQQQVADLQSQSEEDQKALDEASQLAYNSSQELGQVREALTAAETALGEREGELAAASARVEELTGETETLQARLNDIGTQLANVTRQVNEARPLVASLTQSGDAPAFVAQYDPLKKALLIRTAVEDNDEKVPEVWLIPAQGDRVGDVLSLGVMDEAAPDTLVIDETLLPLIGEGGTLAITMEPPGGAPNGVATGPVIALGKLQSF